jgi:hypothetical protein
MTQLGEFGGKASCPEVAVVGMRAEGYDAHRFILGLRRQSREPQYSQKAHSTARRHASHIAPCNELVQSNRQNGFSMDVHFA